MEKLHFNTLKYTLDYTFHHKLFKCTLYTLKYDYWCILHLNVKFVVNLDEKVWHFFNRPNYLSSQSQRTYEKLHFIILNYTPDYTLYSKLWISIQINGKLNIMVQSITWVTVYGLKRAFIKFRLQSIIWSII